jgi:hypothetical protein
MTGGVALGPGIALARVHLSASRNRFALTRRRHPFRVAVQFCVLAPLVAGFAIALAFGLSKSYEQAGGRTDQTAMLAATFTLFIIGGFIGISTAALHALYLAEDVAFMTTLPLPLRVVFASKMADAAAGAIPASILAFGSIGGFAFAGSVSLIYLIAALVGYGALLASSLAVSVTFVAVITRFVPPKRARVYLLMIAFILVAASAATWPLVAPHHNSSGSESVGLDFARSIIARTPAYWIAHAISAAAFGSAMEAAIWLAVSVGATALLLIASFSIFRRVYLPSLARAAEVQTTREARANDLGWLRTLATPLPEPLRAVAVKEWLTLARDFRRLTGIVWPALIVFFYTVVLGKRSASSDFEPELRFWLGNGSLALLPWGLSLGVSIYAFGSEGRMVALMRSLPMTARQVFYGKVFASLIPVGLASLLLTAATLAFRGASLGDTLQMMALVLWMAAGYVVIDTAASTVAPNFEILHIQRAVGLTGRAFSVASGFAFGLATVGGVARSFFLIHEVPTRLQPIFGGDHAFNLMGLPLALASFAAAAGVVALTARIGVRRVETILRVG